MAHGPSEVWSWDITALKGPVKGIWYRCYVVLDIFSRYVTGWLVAAAEDAVVARDFLADAIARNGAEPHTIHADRGGAMVSKPVSELLTDLGVLRSHSRPRTSNDNPYSEARCAAPHRPPRARPRTVGPGRDLLAEPIAPLDRPDCPGLCAVCGIPFDEGTHDHPDDDIDPRLEALRAFQPD